MRYAILKDCVIEHKFYEPGQTYEYRYLRGDTRFIDALVHHGFMKPIKKKIEVNGRVRVGEPYYYIDDTFEIKQTRDIRDEKSDKRFKRGNYMRNYQEAELFKVMIQNLFKFPF